MNRECLKDYKIINKLGQGSFGTAYKVMNIKNKKYYVLKQIFLDQAKKEEKEQITKEAFILSKINNAHVVKYYNSFIEGNSFNIIMEFCEGLDLRKFINAYKKINKPIQKEIIYNFILDLCLGLKEIHNNNLIHRDLKPENIFLDKNNKLKIGDFGISKILKSTKYATSQVGTYNYMAPEIIKGEKYNNKIDIWALGCIIYELCTLNICFDSPSILQLCNKILNQPYEQLNNNKELSCLLDLLLKKNYKERPDIEQVYNLAIQIINKNKKNAKKNEIKLIIEIGKYDINQNIPILGNLKPANGIVTDLIYNNRNFGAERQILKELNELNTDIYINDRKYKFSKIYKFSKEGIYHIKLKFKIEIKDCSYMFFECHNLTSIDLSSFITNNVTNMEAMFFYCCNLKNINLSSFNTQNVTDMNNMFYFCESLKDINLSNFNTQNTTNMFLMFAECHSLISLDLSNFNTQNITNMRMMFACCFSLINLNISNFNTQNATDMSCMFYGCKLKKHNIIVKDDRILNNFNY